MGENPGWINQPDAHAMSRIYNPSAGIDFVRLAIAHGIAARNESPDVAAAIACKRWGESSIPALLAKAAVSAGALEPGAWGAGLAAQANIAADEFFRVVIDVSVLGRLPALRRVPMRTRLLTLDTGATGYWVSEGKAKPLTSMAFGNESIERTKVATIAVLTDELLDNTSRAAEEAIRQDLLRAAVATVEDAFLNPANAGIPGEKPRSITNGVTPIVATSNATSDLKNLVANFSGDLTTAVWIMQPQTAVLLHGKDHPGIGINGGELLGALAVTTRFAPANSILLVDASAIALAEDTAEIKASRQATIEFRSDPVGDSVPPAPTQLVSLWQVDAVALLVERFIGWRVARAGATARLSGIAWT